MSALAQDGPVSTSSNGSTPTHSDDAKTVGFGNEGRWFEIEIIVFSQEENQKHHETWPTNIALAYPPNWKELSEHNTEEHLDTEQLLLTEPYYKLPTDLRFLSPNAKDLTATRKHRILFHEAWRQQVWGKDEAPSLIIAGGNKYGDHFELEGSINISVARYLHLQTNLWFTEFQHNYGQEPNDYPLLPTSPTASTEIADDTNNKSPSSPWDNIQLSKNEYEEILEEPYVSSRIITMKQKRRMRSKEIHYIDHPAIGIIIHITPYELPLEEALDEDVLDGANIDASGETSTPAQPNLL